MTTCYSCRWCQAKAAGRGMRWECIRGRSLAMSKRECWTPKHGLRVTTEPARQVDIPAHLL